MSTFDKDQFFDELFTDLGIPEAAEDSKRLADHEYNAPNKTPEGLQTDWVNIGNPDNLDDKETIEQKVKEINDQIEQEEKQKALESLKNNPIAEKYNSIQPETMETFNKTEYDIGIMDFANDMLAYEAELKEIRAQFKETKRKYVEMGIPVATVSKLIKKIAKDLKASPYDVREESKIEKALINDKQLIDRISTIFNTK